MKAMIVYDSAYGNTEKVALAMGEALASVAEVETEPGRGGASRAVGGD